MHEPVVVRLGYSANATHAQAVLGVESGDIARAIAPAVLETQHFNAGPSIIEALFAGELDIAYIGPGPALTAYQRSRGEGIRVIAGAANDGVVVVARKDLGIDSFDDLKGRRIATPQIGNTQDLSARHFLTARFGEAGAANVVPIRNSEQVGMMRRGDIDAAWVPEPWGQLLVEQADAEVVLEEKDLWPEQTFLLTVVVTTPTFLERHPDVLRKFLAVNHDWTLKLQSDRAQYLDLLGEGLLKLNGKALPQGVLATAMQRIRFDDVPDQRSFAAFNTWSTELALSRSIFPLDGLVDTSLLENIAPNPDPADR